jgi:ATP-binding cassette subfamily B protein
LSKPDALTQRYFGDVALMRKLWREIRPFWPQLIICLLAVLSAMVIAIAFPLPLRLGVDNVIAGEPLNRWFAYFVPDSIENRKNYLLLFAIGMWVGLGVALQVRGLIWAVLRTWVGEHMIMRLRAKLFRHSQTLSLGFHDEKGVADSLYRIQYDALAIEQVSTNGLIPLVGEIATVVGVVVAMAIVDWQLTIVTAVVTPFLLLVTHLYRGHLRRRWSRSKSIESSVVGVVQEVLASLRVVKAFGQETRELERFSDHAYRGVRAKVRAVALESSFGMLVGTTVAIGSGVVMGIGVWHVQSGTLTQGGLAQIIIYLMMLYKPLENIGLKFGILQQALASANRAFALLEESPDVVEKPDARAVDTVRGEVEFAGVEFDYGEGHRVLHELSFRAAAGSKVGISGHTGSGKTTLISLLMRFYDPSSGVIRLDGVDLRDYRLDDLRRQFAIVLQDTVLFSGTIAENIAYGKPDANRSEIVEAATLANADEFIRRLPEGYDSEVGERGMRLSGGERQRIALARAFLRDAAILILDEPTSAVDVKTESLVMEAIERLMQGRTTFMISHRPNTLDACDVRLVLDRGRLVSAGV